MKSSPIDPDLLARMYSKSKYAKDFGLSRRTLDRQIEDGKVESITIKGSIIVLAATDK